MKFLSPFLLAIFLFSSVSADVVLIENDKKNSETIGEAGSTNTLYFGEQLQQFLQFDPSKNAFIFSSDVDFSGNQLINMKLENLSTAPICNAAAKGRAYHNTTDTHSYVCNGKEWKILDTNMNSNPPLSPFIESINPKGIAINTTQTIRITGINFDNTTIFFTNSATGTINSHRVIDGETAELVVSAGGSEADIVIQAKNGTQEWTGNKTILKITSSQSIDDVLINFSNANIAQYIPSVFPINFDMGTDGATYINDGGTGLPNENDMYDRGNYLRTNLATNIPYTGGRLVSGHAAWGGGKYLTNIKNNIFFLAGEIGTGVDSFSVTGNLGADGRGSTNTLKLSYGGYDAYIKQVYGAGSNPSVNHMFIVKSGSAVTHTASTNTDNDLDTITGLQSVKASADPKFYYILFATRMGGYVDNTTMSNVLAYVVDTIIH